MIQMALLSQEEREVELYLVFQHISIHVRGGSNLERPFEDQAVL